MCSAATQKKLLSAESQVNELQGRLSDAVNQRRHWEDEDNKLKKEYDALAKSHLSGNSWANHRKIALALCRTTVVGSTAILTLLILPYANDEPTTSLCHPPSVYPSRATRK